MSVHRRLWLFILLVLLSAPGGFAQEKSLKPGINKSYADPDLKQSVQRFEGESREIFEKRQEILGVCRLKSGLVVADIGAGTGLFTRLMAAQVRPAGKVYAVDISAKFLAHIEKTCREAKITNVTTVLASDTSTRLAPASIDVAFICDTYHHFEYPFKMLASIHQALRPGGRLVLVDYKRQEGKSEKWVMGHVRADQATVVKEITAAGFHFCDAPDLMAEQFALRFERISK